MNAERTESSLMWDDRRYQMPLIWRLEEQHENFAAIVPIRKLDQKKQMFASMFVIILFGIVMAIGAYRWNIDTEPSAAVWGSFFSILTCTLGALGVLGIRLWQLSLNRTEPDVIFSIDTHSDTLLTVRGRTIQPSKFQNIWLEYVRDHAPNRYLAGNVSRFDLGSYEEINLVIEGNEGEERIGIVAAMMDVEWPSKVKPIAQRLAELAGCPLVYKP